MMYLDFWEVDLIGQLVWDARVVDAACTYSSSQGHL